MEIKEGFSAAAEAVTDFIGDTVREYEVMADNLLGGPEQRIDIELIGN